MSGGDRWQFWIDRGGTFTDCLGRDPTTGKIHVAKLLSSDRAPLQAIRQILELDAGAPIPACDIRMGTTVATNALLERKGVGCALVITRGFGDLLEIGTQARPAIFELAIEKPERLYRAVLEVDARLDSEGHVLARPDPAELRRELVRLLASGCESLAVVVLHAYANGELEREIGQLADNVGFRYVSLSHRTAAELGMLARGDTTAVDAYLTPLIRDYLNTLLEELPGSTLSIMQSSGGLIEAAQFGGTNAILSGPAAGVVAYAKIAQRLGFRQAIGFDMGGTSTDVSRFGGDFERVYESEVAGVRLRAPMMSIHTVAAGGGSLCRFDGHRLSVGPESAGANPGPLCYGHPDAIELTVTDVNLTLGRLQADRFPFPLDAERSRASLDELAEQLRRRGIESSVEQIAEGFFEIANNNMAQAIRRVSIARGHDVRGHALMVFGGAGGQHACALARRLGIRSIVFHPFGGVLSAYGMGVADIAWHGDADAGRPTLSTQALHALDPVLSRLEARGRAVLKAHGSTHGRIAVVRRLDLRYSGSDTALTLELTDAHALESAFHAQHELLFGYARRSHPIEVVVARIEVVFRDENEQESGEWASFSSPSQHGAPLRTARLFHGGRWQEDVPVYRREALGGGQGIDGPALILDATATIVIDPGFFGRVSDDGMLLVSAAGSEAASRPEAGQCADGPDPDPVLLDIMANVYMSIAEQMGEVLRRTALSTNIRERLDYSCAVFDARGGLVANAPHIPVHLGAMGESVRSVIEAEPHMLAGDVFITNDPAGGGSHLPDVTVVTPVHDAAGQLLFFTASRGHHADVGGLEPGSMPPFSTRIEEEGVVFSNLRIMRGKRFDRDGVLARLLAGPYPARNPEHNIADLLAQIAANRAGATLLLELVEQYGLAVVARYMQHVQDNAAAKVSEQIAALGDGEYRFEDALDDGTPIRVCLRVSGASLHIDFSGTGSQHAGNLNAPRAVTIAAVIYFLRTLVGEPIPLNSGCLRPVRISIEQGSLLWPDAGRAVAAGNVETSQRVVDVLLGAAKRAAASQGTMNNLTFGDASFGYYETIAGGAGAGPGFDGASAVHTHMTNTRITDPEVLESRFPVRLLEFSIRRGSGGAGRWHGGDGICRELEFLRKVRVSILSERRTRAPFGLEGGAPGSPGQNLVNGRTVPARVTLELGPGDRLRIETPGGGGFGAA